MVARLVVGQIKLFKAEESGKMTCTSSAGAGYGKAACFWPWLRVMWRRGRKLAQQWRKELLVAAARGSWHKVEAKNDGWR